MTPPASTGWAVLCGLVLDAAEPAAGSAATRDVQACARRELGAGLGDAADGVGAGPSFGRGDQDGPLVVRALGRAAPMRRRRPRPWRRARASVSSLCWIAVPPPAIVPAASTPAATFAKPPAAPTPPAAPAVPISSPRDRAPPSERTNSRSTGKGRNSAAAVSRSWRRARRSRPRTPDSDVPSWVAMSA